MEKVYYILEYGPDDIRDRFTNAIASSFNACSIARVDALQESSVVPLIKPRPENGNHIDIEQMLDYLRGRLHGKGKEPVERHMFGCIECRRALNVVMRVMLEKN